MSDPKSVNTALLQAFMCAGIDSPKQIGKETATAVDTPLFTDAAVVTAMKIQEQNNSGQKD